MVFQLDRRSDCSHIKSPAFPLALYLFKFLGIFPVVFRFNSDSGNGKRLIFLAHIKKN